MVAFAGCSKRDEFEKLEKGISVWPTLESRPSARGWTGPSGQTSGSREAAPELGREREVVGNGAVTAYPGAA